MDCPLFKAIWKEEMRQFSSDRFPQVTDGEKVLTPFQGGEKKCSKNGDTQETDFQAIYSARHQMLVFEAINYHSKKLSQIKYPWPNKTKQEEDLFWRDGS